MSDIAPVPSLYKLAGGMPVFEMICHHLSKHLTQQRRLRWVELLLQMADELQLPDDPEFRSAFLAYLEWEIRIAVINSNLDSIDEPPDMPMPEWGWGVPGGPFKA
jgi:hemoglobin